MGERVIGIVGGMGSYATLDFFGRILDHFPAEKEWDRPRVIIDNYCTMPSRVRALLYGERREELVQKLLSSIENLIKAGATDLILCCNTSHCFIDDILKLKPNLSNYIIDIIEASARQADVMKVAEAFLIASEGTIATGIYAETFKRYGIKLSTPIKDDQILIREFIEAAKQNKITDDVCKKFKDFILKLPCKTVILGCTEIPIIFRASRADKLDKLAIDPLECALFELDQRITKGGV